MNRRKNIPRLAKIPPANVTVAFGTKNVENLHFSKDRTKVKEVEIHQDFIWNENVYFVRMAKVGKHRIVRYCESFPYCESSRVLFGKHQHSVIYPFAESLIEGFDCISIFRKIVCSWNSL